MFKRFTPKESVASQSQVKSSVQRGIRQGILEQYPMLEQFAEVLFPKKSTLVVARCTDHVNLFIVNNQVLFFNVRNGPYFPTLRILHQYGNLLPQFQADKGAIKFVLRGADIMCPGLTSPGGKLVDVEPETAVAIYAEGKTFPMAVGLTKMSTKEIREVNKGIAVELTHFLGDGLWENPQLE